ncbi:MAG: hypothetical protein JOY71_14390 [Acetobacteraceae bacterium]|nr:hypothetical protein [Acetobacteraceae bacterium]
MSEVQPSLGSFVNASVTSPVVVKAAPGVVQTVTIYASTAGYIELFDAASTSGITPGTTAPRWAMYAPVGVMNADHVNLAFFNGIVIATATAITSGSTGPSMVVSVVFD